VRFPLVVVATPEAGLRVLDVSNPALPCEVGAFDTVGYWWDFYAVALVDSFAFTGGGILYSILLSDPANPVGFRSGFWIQNPTSLIVRGRWLYSAESNRFHVFDIISPRSPTMVSEVRMPIWTDGMCVQDTLAYVGCGFTGLFIINVAQPARPIIVDTFKISSPACGVFVKDTLAYVTGRDSGLRVINVRDPHAPFVVSSLLGGWMEAVTGVGDRLYVGRGDGLLVLDISDPTHPTEVGHYEIPGAWCRSVVVDSGLIYCTHDRAGICILECLFTGTREIAPVPPALNMATISGIVRNRAVVHINSAKGGEAQARVFDIHGRMVLREMRELSAGPSSISLDLSRLPVGVYFIQLTADKQVTTFKMAKIAR
jgi:hypothetical protein